MKEKTMVRTKYGRDCLASKKKVASMRRKIAAGDWFER